MGGARRDLPETFGPWSSVYQRFARWQARGVWQRMFDGLAGNANCEEVSIDSTVMRVHQQADAAGAQNKTASRPSVGRAAA